MFPSALNAAKAGLSDSFSRIHSDTANSPADARNGTRQPQAAKAVSPNAVRVASVTRSAAVRPTAAEVWMKLV